MKEKRQRDLLSYIISEKSVSVAELSDIFQVSKMTVRRDLDELEATGLVARVSGGVVAATGTEQEPSYKTREAWNDKQKGRIAAMVDELVRNGDLIFLDVGTTCLRCAEKLRRRPITVVTSWVPNTIELAKDSAAEVILLGGRLDKTELLTVGVAAYNAVGDYNFVRAIIGVGGISESGIYDYRVESVEIKRRVMECSREVIVVADHSKFGRNAPVHIAPLEKVNKIIVADKEMLSESVLAGLESRGVEVLG